MNWPVVSGTVSQAVHMFIQIDHVGYYCASFNVPLMQIIYVEEPDRSLYWCFKLSSTLAYI